MCFFRLQVVFSMTRKYKSIIQNNIEVAKQLRKCSFIINNNWCITNKKKQKNRPSVPQMCYRLLYLYYCVRFVHGDLYAWLYTCQVCIWWLKRTWCPHVLFLSYDARHRSNLLSAGPDFVLLLGFNQDYNLYDFSWFFIWTIYNPH